MWAGLPFFIRIGVSQASAAPAAILHFESGALGVLHPTTAAFPRPRVGTAEGRQALELVLAVYESARTGKPVALR